MTTSATGIPRQVTVAFWLYLAAALLASVGAVMAAMSVRPAMSHLHQSDALPAGAATTAFWLGVGFATLIETIFAAAYVVFAVFMCRGANWARIALLVVTAISLIGVVGGHGVGAAIVIVGVIATILTFVNPSSEYYRSKAQTIGSEDGGENEKRRHERSREKGLAKTQRKGTSRVRANRR
ncbi:hypothetical protein [Leifsonia sp. LS-T14]|uniref:hypothetical protein n=1 Tax=unclassified Leifsonia TaxID=2663824 RepID=UPI0035A58682